jgi:hypothetical protein
MLNCKIQAERNYEMRHQAQRIRLEAERVKIQAYVDMYELSLRYSSAKPTPPSADRSNGAKIAAVTLSEAASAVLEQHARKQVKPDGLPTLTEMIVTVLAEAVRQGRDSLAPREIRAVVRKRWWPDVPYPVIASAVWRLGKADRLRKVGGGQYGLNDGRQSVHHEGVS